MSSPAPPAAAGIPSSSRPSSPARSDSVRGSSPSSSQRARFGTISRRVNPATSSRSASRSGVFHRSFAETFMARQA